MAFTGIELARVKKVAGGICEGRTWPEICGRMRSRLPRRQEQSNDNA